MASFITGAQLVVRYDWRWIAQQVTDTGTPPTNATDLADLQVITDLIAEASEMVLAAASVGARYSEDDLTPYWLDITTGTLDPAHPGGGHLLVRIVCDLTMGLILKRRARATEDLESLFLPYKEALEYLEQLRRGERIFADVPDVPEAGLPGTASMSPTIFDQPPYISTNQRIFGDVGLRRLWPNGY